MNHELREGKYHATPAELAVIHRGLKSADEGRFATDAAKALEGAKGKRLMYRQPR